jgi:hypothetical protein
MIAFERYPALGRTREAEAELARQWKVSVEFEASRSRSLGGVKTRDIQMLGPREPRE